MTQTMFERLQGLPLLVGLSVNDLMNIVEKVNFDFGKHTEGTNIVGQGDRCNRVVYVLQGSVCVYFHDSDTQMLLSEYVDDVPFAIELHNLWGMHQEFERTYTFATDGNTCCIDKQQLNVLITNYEIVKANLLSTVCNRAQLATLSARRPIGMTTEERICNFFSNYFMTTTGRKVVRMKMERLAQCIDETRLNVSKVLKTWEDHGWIEVLRGRFVIHDAAKMYQNHVQLLSLSNI